MTEVGDSHSLWPDFGNEHRQRAVPATTTPYDGNGIFTSGGAPGGGGPPRRSLGCTPYPLVRRLPF